MYLSMCSSFIPLVHCVQAFTHLRTNDFFKCAYFYFVVSVIQRVTDFGFYFYVVVSVIQRVTAWATGVPVLKLVTSGEEASGPSNGTAPRKDSTSKKRKRTLRAMEDEEMYRKLRDGKPVERNTRLQNELVQLQKGMCLFVCLFVCCFF